MAIHRPTWLAPLALAGVLVAAGAGVPAARAQTLIRDAGIEYSLDRLAQPVLAASGLNPGRMRVMVLRDDEMNAFVLDSQTIMVNSGLLLRLQSAAQLQAVLAHEAAHIANGHIARRLANLRGANRTALTGLLLSMAVAASGNAEAGLGVAAGSAGVAQRGFLSHTRAEEAAADQAGLRYLADAGIDPQAAVEVIEMFRGQEALSVGRRDPYVQTHPLTRDRLRALKGFAAAYDGPTRPDAAADYWFARAKGKLSAFLRNPSWTLRRTEGEGNSLATLRRAVALHRRPAPAEAMAAVDRLVAQRPRDPFAQELRGQILLESRRFGPAIAAYARAVRLAPDEPLIRAGYGHALLTRKTAATDRKALAALKTARGRDPRDARMLRDLAVAYARAGQNGMASLVTAERYAVRGRLGAAVTHARRAAGALPRGSAGWLRAQDVLKAAELARKRR